MIEIFEGIILTFEVICALMVTVSKNLLTSVVIYMTFSLMQCILWLCLRSPDLAVTEAAVGAVVDSVLFFITLKNVGKLKEEGEDDSNE